MRNFGAKQKAYAALRARQGLGASALLIFSASCVPATMNSGAAPAASAMLASESAALPATPPPAPEPFVLQPVAPDTAAAMNAAIPVVDGYNPAARPFRLTAASAIDRMRSMECLTSAIYYEAASESDDGQRAVAQVVLNRLRHPTYPNSVCGVVYQGSERSSGCQFSFTCDGSLLRKPSASGWARARRIAAEALSGKVYAPVGHPTHYHTYQVLPYWASSLAKSAVIGAHIFYRWNGGWGRPSAFTQSYSGREALPAPKPPQLVVLPVSAMPVQAEIAAVVASGKQIAAPYLAVAGAAALPAPQAPAPDSGGPKLPDSQVLDIWKNSGVPRDQLPGAK